MNDVKVMRSVYLGVAEDIQLRQIAFDAKLTKSDLIRAAIAVALHRWVGMEDSEIQEEVAAAGRLNEDESTSAPSHPPAEPATAVRVAKVIGSRRPPEKKPERRPTRTRSSTEAKQSEHQQRELASPNI